MEKIIKAKKQRKGITLVSLVVTIIVLLILAGITINLIIGEDGIIRRAQEAGKNYIDAAENEKLQLGVFTNEMDNLINGSVNNGRIPYNSEFRSKVIEAISAEGIKTLETDTDDVIIGNIRKIFEERTKLDSEVAAISDNIIAGKQAWVNGTKVIGTMENNGAWTNTPTASGKVTIPAGYHNGSGYVNTATVYNNGYNAGYSEGKSSGVGAEIVYSSKVNERGRWVIDFTATENVKNGLLVITVVSAGEGCGADVYGSVTSPLNPVATGGTLTQVSHVLHGLNFAGNSPAFNRVLIYKVNDLETTDKINLQIGLSWGYSVQIIKFN